MKYKLKTIADKVEISFDKNKTEIFLKKKYINRIDKIIQADNFDNPFHPNTKYYLYKNKRYIRSLGV